MSPMYVAGPTPFLNLMNWPPLRLYLRDGGRQSFPVIDLIYLQAEVNYSWLQWDNGRRMLMPRTLKYYTPQLPAEWFIRLHNKIIVNRAYIQRTERTESGGLVYLTTGEIFTISRRRWPLIRQQLRAEVA